MPGRKRRIIHFVLGFLGLLVCSWPFVQAHKDSLKFCLKENIPRSFDQNKNHSREEGPFESTFSENELSLAAYHLEKGEYSRACVYLSHYVRTHPENLRARAHYADLLLCLGEFHQASQEYGQYILLSQEAKEDLLPEQIHSHRRIMEIAEILRDEYDFHLNKGIGLYLLAQCKGCDKEFQVHGESLLCQAAGELCHARLLEPGQARPCYYLYLVWSRLGQKQLALRCLREAQENAAFSFLTPMEQEEMVLAELGSSPFRETSPLTNTFEPIPPKFAP